MNDFLADRARVSPRSLALIFEDEAWTYAELNTQVGKVCARLHALGVAKDDVVAVHFSNCPAHLLLVHSLIRLGAVILPLNQRLTYRELDDILTRGCANWLVGEDAVFDDLSGIVPSQQTIRWSQIEPQDEATPEKWLSRKIRLSQQWGLMFTSGTSGRPKGAILSLGNIYSAAMASALRLGTLPEDRWLLTMPMYHIGGLSIVIRCCIYGTTVVLEEGFDPEVVWQRMEQHSVTLMSLVPTMLKRMLLVSEKPWPLSVRMVLLGGAMAPREVLEAAHARGVPVSLTYGLTEASSQVATALPEQVAEKPGSVGKPLYQTSVRIAKEGGSGIAAPGQVGEIQVRGPGVMYGYLNQPPISGWLHTGDMGFLDPAGDLFVVQRRSDLIVSGGENVYPIEVEQALCAHPAVTESCVVGIPDDDLGQRVAAAVVRTDHSLTREDIIRYLRDRLAGYKIPRVITFTEDLPHTASGKVCRPDVIELIENEARVHPGTGQK